MPGWAAHTRPHTLVDRVGGAFGEASFLKVDGLPGVLDGAWAASVARARVCGFGKVDGMGNMCHRGTESVQERVGGAGGRRMARRRADAWGRVWIRTSSLEQ